MKELKKKIEQAIREFAHGDLKVNTEKLLNTLGYHSLKKAAISIESLKRRAASRDMQQVKYAMWDEWVSADLIFQITSDEIKQAASLFDFNVLNEDLIQSYLFFAIEMKQASYTRGTLSQITRFINRLYDMPVLILFKYGQQLTLSVINRRLHKLDKGRDVLEKVTLIKDIFIFKPVRAHIEILFDLSFGELQRKHPLSNFIELHNAWQKTLDTKELNKRFFQDIANWYFWALQNVVFPDGIEKNKELRNSTNLIRLITRIIFIWFIKEKSLVPNNLFDPAFLDKIFKDFNSSRNSTGYYKAILQNLFFATLNQKMTDREFADDSDKHNKEDQGIKTKYRYPELFNISKEEVKRLFADVPFLNGGLFDCLDRFDPAKLEKGIKDQVFVDGFTRIDYKQPFVPDYIFFGNEIEVDHNKVYGTKGKRFKTQGLINILNNYKFTIAENTPIEEEIALDPELLGKVFENLLASYNPETKTNARNQTGSFYTPREIVNYMVDESLLEYLKQSWKSESIEFETQLRELFSYSANENPFGETETRNLVEAINNCKILDPACGSGAFPMGILHRMVHLLQKLDPGNELWKEHQREKIIGEQIRQLEKDKNAIQGLSDRQVREKAIQAVEERLDELEKIFNRNYNFDDYSRKLYLIENCIYGIDIQTIAVQIAKLRFFISLVIDQKVNKIKDNYGIRSLPNLETKFVAANTLIGLEIPTANLFSESNPVKIYEDQLKGVRHEYFTAKTREDKLRLQKQDKELRKKIAKELEDALINKQEEEFQNLKSQLNEARKNLSLIESQPEQLETISTTNIFGETEIKTFDKKKEKIKSQNSIIKNLEKQLAILTNADNKDEVQKTAQKIALFDPYDQNRSSDWFEIEWMFGLKTGFDVVIGNPPYIAGKSGLIDDKEKKYFNNEYETAEYQLDTYVLFTEKGTKLLNQTGFITFIMPNTWLANINLKKIRKYLLEKTSIFEILIMPDNVFSTAVVDTAIIFCKREFKANNKIKVSSFKDWSHTELYYVEQCEFLKNEKYIIDIGLNNNARVLLRKIRNETYTVGQLCFVNRGVHAYRKDGYGKSKFTEGFQTERDYNEKSYHSKEKIDDTYYQEVRGKNIFPYYFELSPMFVSWGDWLAESREWKYFHGERIYLRKIVGKTLYAAYVNSQNVADQSVYIAKIKNENQVQVKYLLSILNSKLIAWYFRVLANEFDDLFPQIKVSEFRDLPIKISFNQNQFTLIVDQILTARQSNPHADTTALENRIDELVFKLYGLTYEEVKVIAPDFWLGEEEYEKVRVES